MQTHLSWFMYQYSNVFNHYLWDRGLRHLQSVRLHTAAFFSVTSSLDGVRDDRETLTEFLRLSIGDQVPLQYTYIYISKDYNVPSRLSP